MIGVNHIAVVSRFRDNLYPVILAVELIAACRISIDELDIGLARFVSCLREADLDLAEPGVPAEQSTRWLLQTEDKKRTEM